MEPSRDDPADDLRPEYDLTQLRGGVRGKYARKMAHGDGYEQTAGDVSQNGHPTGDEEAAFRQRVWNAMQPVFSRSIVPISWSNGANFGIFGTGTLFRVGGLSFLVTANHVLTDADARGYGLAICDDRPGASALPLGGRVSGHTIHDVAVIELDAETVASMPNRTFLTVHQADRRSRRPPQGIYGVCGFPSVQATPDREQMKLSAIPFSAFVGLYIGPTNTFQDRDPAKDYSPVHHLLLDAERSGSVRLDSEVMPLPARLNGMSGCSIWQISYTGLSPRHWTPDDAVIVGVQIGVYKNGTVIKGTRWWVVDQLIREAYPELAGPLDLHIPMSGT